MSDLLSLQQVSAGYGDAIVISKIDLSLKPGESLAVLGRNGTGKTTLLNTIIGVTRHRGGAITLAGRTLTGMSPDRRALAGIGWMPQERNIFKSLTVEENITAVARSGPWTLSRVYAMFPRLKERAHQLAGTLSGGERQMLALGRALMSRPRVLLLDEPSLGLAPKIVQDILRTIATLKAAGVAVLLVEQNARAALEIADDAHVMELGEFRLSGKATEVAADPAVVRAYLGLGAA